MTVSSAGWRQTAKYIGSTLAIVSILVDCGHVAVVRGRLVACNLFTVSDARQLLADGSAAKTVSLPGVNACSYFIPPGARAARGDTAEVVGITLFINFHNAPKGAIPVEVDGHPARWLMATGDVGVLSFAAQSNAFVVTVSGTRLPSTTSKHLAERAAAIVLSRL
jgi:hypothetical protein